MLFLWFRDLLATEKSLFSSWLRWLLVSDSILLKVMPPDTIECDLLT